MSGAPVGRFHSVRGLAVGCALLVVVTVVLALGDDSYGITFWRTILMTVTLAVTWNLIGGLAGQHSFAHPIMFGVGAYVGTAVLGAAPAMPLWIVVILGALAATAVSVLLTPAFRARGPYFAILTIAASEGLRVAGNAFFPGGSAGQYVPITASPSDSGLLVYAIVITLVAIVLHHVVDESPIGSGLRMLAIDESAAAAVGVPTTRLKVTAFVLGAPCVGAFGVVYMAGATFVDPNTVFNLNYAVLAVLTTLLGGVGLLWGAVFGAVVWQLVTKQLSDSIQNPGIATMVNGAALLVVILVLPGGIVGTALATLPARWRDRFPVPRPRWTRKAGARGEAVPAT
ncbi:branched-chain amino acid ABC transporter permease [Pseudonocardia ailaonensis]|uniref:Branched-chain amino acid ABC transporter permease n=1 Tax=Pseudonocardia ailaonensis TaxID=367279 RepID=A0ABN2N2B7_9PSEU